MSTVHAPIHPGEVLLEEFLAPLGISQYRLAKAIGVPPRRINEIVHGQPGNSPERHCGCRELSVRRTASG